MSYIHQDELIIRKVLLDKFLNSRIVFNNIIYHLLNDSKKWTEEALLFKLPYEIKRRDLNKWETEGDYHWDTMIICSFYLNQNIVKNLLEIQPIEFWKLYLELDSYKFSMNQLAKLSNYEDFLNKYHHNFPKKELSILTIYLNNLFQKIESEDVLSKLKQKKIELYFIEETGNGNMQINMMNILLYSILFELNHIEITIICVYICYIMIYIKIGLDADKNVANITTINKWNENGNWGKILNYYLYLAFNNMPSIIKNYNYDLEKCLNQLIKENALRIYPFKFYMVNLKEISNFKNEKMRFLLNQLRQKNNSEELIEFNLH